MSMFSFLTPLWLCALFALPLLIFAYLRKQQSKRYVVSSVLVLKTLSRRVAPKKRFFPPLRFFLELLALLCLGLAAAQPFLDLQGERIAVLFDNSLSMRAQTGKEKDETRFHKAQDEVRKWVSKQAAASTYSLFRASPRLQLVGNEETNSQAFLRQVEVIEPTSAPDALEGSASELLASEKYDKVLIVSDKSVELEKGVQGVESLSVGGPRANLAIQSMRIEQGGIGGGKDKLLVAVSYSGDGSGSVPVQLSFLSPDGQAKKLDSQQVSVRPEGLSEVSFELPATAAGSGFFRASLETGKGDAIRDDNAAYLVAEKQEQAGVLLVHGSEEQGELGLNEISELLIRSVSPEEFSKMGAEELRKYLVVIFHRTAPVQFLEQPTLVVVPPLKNPLFPGTQEVASPRISSWISEHPITNYLRVPLLTPPASIVFQENLWGKPIVRSESGPVLLAGEGRGVRFAVLGFEIFPFEGAKTPVPSVLTLNLLSWLRGGMEIGGERRTGGTLPIRENEESLSRIVGRLSNDEKSVQPENGVLELKDSGGYVVKEKGSTVPKLYAVNLFHAEESNTFQTQSIAISSGIKREAGDVPRGLPLWNILAWTALGFIVLESLLALVRPREETA